MKIAFEIDLCTTYDTYLEIRFSSVGTPGLAQGNIIIGGTGRRRSWAIFGKDDVKNILKEAFCDNIISGSIVTGSCDLQVLDYNTATGVAKYILSFEILDATALEKSLYIINKDIATNTAITASGQFASPGTIGKFRNHPKVSLLGVVALLGDCTFIPADWGL